MAGAGLVCRVSGSRQVCTMGTFGRTEPRQGFGGLPGTVPRRRKEGNKADASRPFRTLLPHLWLPAQDRVGLSDRPLALGRYFPLQIR